VDILEGEGGSLPENAEALALAAQARLTAGQPTQAIDAAEQLQRLQPDSTAPYLLLARAYAATGESGQVQEQMQRILERDPDNALALIVGAQSRLYEQELDEAREYLERVPDEARAHPAYLAARGRLAAQEDELGAARDYYKRAHDAAPSGESVTRLAEVVHALGHDDQAEVLLREWVEEHPQDTGAQQALGDLYIRQDRSAEAGEAYKAVLEQNPGSVEALNNLAWILREEEPEEALGYAEHAASLQPEDPRVLDTFGMVLLENGETERAVRQLREAVSLAPNAGVLRYHLARALVSAGRRDEARAELDRALSGNPRFAEVEEARSLMEELRSTE
jgi:putative PEP-CTERM system TPR-repeat lipoprotein